jgi:transmembrane sensor
VDLAQGEAWFQVAKAPDRPFTVTAGRVRVQAVGTAFNVRRAGVGVDVVVTEGTVKVWSEGAEPQLVKAGQRARLDDGVGWRSARSRRMRPSNWPGAKGRSCWTT